MNNISFSETKLILQHFSLLLSHLENLKSLNIQNGKILIHKEEFKKYFVDYTLIVFYAEFESKLKKVLESALKKHSKPELADFIIKTMDTIFRRMDKNDLKKTVSYFGNKSKNKFESLVIDKVDIWRQYQKFIENRHNVAHSNNPISLSWEEMIDETNQNGARKSIDKVGIDKVGEEIISVVKESLEL